MNPNTDLKAAATKRLLALGREQSVLWRAIRNLPPVELAEPYQSGWERSFQLSARSKRRRDYAILEVILAEVNTTVFCRNSQFYLHRRKKGRRRFVSLDSQGLQRIRQWRWELLRWPDLWKTRYFNVLPHPVARMAKYEVARPDVFEGCIKPHLVTHTRACCPEWEARLREIDSILQPLGGWNRIAYLKGHSSREWGWHRSARDQRSDCSWKAQIRELRNDGVISKALCLQGFQGFSDHVLILFRTSSIEGMQRAFNAQSRERYPGGSPILFMGDKH